MPATPRRRSAKTGTAPSERAALPPRDRSRIIIRAFKICDRMISRIEQHLDEGPGDHTSPAETAALESLSRVLERLIKLDGQQPGTRSGEEDQQLRERLASRIAKALKGRKT